MVELVAVLRPLIGLASGFVISIICVLAVWKLLPKILGIPVYELIGQNKKGAGYYYIFAGLVTAGAVNLSLNLGSELSFLFDVEEVALKALLGLGGSLIGLALSIVICIATLRLCDYATTQIHEWDLVKSGNEAAGLYFVGVGLVVFSVLIGAAWFPRTWT